jgi:L-seryl-tRNA(Ser) seleniumtransferase
MEARREIPTLALLGASITVVRERAERVQRLLATAGVECELLDTSATVGGGAFALAEIPSAALALAGDAERWASRLRAGDPPVIGRVTEGRMLLDFRAVTDAAVDLLVSSVVAARD